MLLILVDLFSVEPEPIEPLNPVNHLPFLKGVEVTVDTLSALTVSFWLNEVATNKLQIEKIYKKSFFFIKPILFFVFRLLD